MFFFSSTEMSISVVLRFSAESLAALVLEVLLLHPSQVLACDITQKRWDGCEVDPQGPHLY